MKSSLNRQKSKIVERFKRIIFPVIGIVGVLGFFLWILFFRSSTVEAVWFDDNWLYRKAVPLTNSSGSEQTDFQVMISWDTTSLVSEGKIQSDCDDFRVTDINGNKLEYWLEPGTCNTATTKIWTKVSSIPTSGATVYVYYGNSSAISESSTTNTFIREIDNVQGAWDMDEASWNGTPSEVIDSSGNSNHGVRAGDATTAAGKFGNAGTFDGVSDYVSVADSASLDFGTGNFTLEAWVKSTEAVNQETDQLGDIMSKFDQTNKKGFNLGFLRQSLHSQSNNRNLYFGIDNNHPDTGWVEKAPMLGAETYIISMAVYNGKLYGGTASNGKLYEWNGTDAWVEKAPTLGAQSHIYPLAVYNNKLYGGTGPNGKLYEWNGTDAWVEKAPQLGTQTYINSLAVYNGKLYGGAYPNGKLYEWNGTDAWVEKAPQLGAETHANSLAVYNGKLYTGTSPNGKLYEWNGINAWVEKAPKLGAETNINTLAVYNGKLYGGTGQNGKLYEWNGIDAWVEKAAKLGTEVAINTLAVYNGKLYGGTSLSGKLYEWNGTNAWVEKAPQLVAEVTIRSLAVYNGKLYGGTGQNGKLYEWKTGVAASYDYEVPASWQHIAAVKDTTSLKLYLNGSLIDTSDAFDSVDYDLSNAYDLLIGFGQQDYLKGDIDELRIYNRVLTQAEITDIYSLGGTNQGYVTSNYPNKELVRKYSSGVTVGVAGSEEKSPGPVAYWKFDEGTGTTAQDSTDNNNDGTISGATWTSEDMCVSGKCLKFDGIDDGVSVPTQTLGNSSALSFSVWFRQNSTAGNQNLIWGLPAGPGSGIYLTSNREIVMQLDLETGDYQRYSTSTSVYSLNTWNHVVGTFNSGTFKIFLNGIELSITDTGGSGSGNFVGETTYYVGYETGANYFNGFLDEVKIYPYVRSAAQILSDYNSRGSVHGASVEISPESKWISDGLVGYWKMDESSGTRYDSSGNGNNLTDNNTVTANTGKFGNAGQFTAANHEYLSIANNSTIQIGNYDFTYSVWVYPTSFSGNWLILNKYNPTADIQLQHAGSGQLWWYIYGTGDWAAAMTSTAALTLNSWNHVIVWHDSVNDKAGIVINNGTAQTASLVNQPTTGGTGTFSIGGDGGSYDFNGRIEEVRMYKRVLSGAERRALYNFAPGPVAEWRMDEGSGGSAYDTSGNGNTGTLTNSPEWATGKYGKGLSFDGTNDYVSVADNASLDFGTGNFTLEAWVKPKEDVNSETDQIGDILTKFDQTNKKGFNLGFLRQSSSFGSQSNNRNLFFGIDNNHPDTAWVEKAPQLGTANYIRAMAVYNGKLYGANGSNGKLYEWNGTNAWVEKAPQLGAETSFGTLAVYNGKLYGGTGQNGKLYEWNGTDAWVEKAPKLGTETNAVTLAVYNGKLYVGTAPNAKLYEWNGTNAWVEKAPRPGSEIYIMSMTVYNGKLYGASANHGKLYEWNGTDAWVEKAPQLGTATFLYSLVVYNSKLYASTAGQGKLYEWNGTNAWVEKAPQLGTETYVSCLAIYNGKLYGGTYPNGKLYEWNGTNAWVEKAPKLGTETWIRSIAVYNGKLYAGTADNGKLYEWKTGAAASYDYEVPAGWQYVTAVKDTTSLKLYLNGTLVDTSDSFNSGDYDLSNTNELLLGFGEQDYLKGSMDQVRIYNYARTPKQVVEDMNTGHPAVGSPIGSALAYYKFDEGYGTTANNAGFGGSSLNGTLSNMSSPATSTSGWTSSGKYGEGLVFDGNDDYVTVTDNDMLSFGNGTTDRPFSISTWIKATDMTSLMLPMKTTVNQLEYYFVTSASDKLVFDIFSGNNVNNYIGRTYNTALTNYENEWIHLVATYDGSANTSGIRLYLNGERVDDTDRSGGTYTAMSNTSSPINIGNYSTAYANGTIDEVKIYNYSLTEDEVKTEYNEGAALVLGNLGTNTAYASNANSQTYCVPGDSTSCSSPVAEWKFDEGTSTSAYDTSGNANTGTLTDGPAWTNGKYGKSVKLDGTNDFVNISSASSLSFGTGNFTINAWVKNGTNNFILMDNNNSVIRASVATGSAANLWFRDSAAQTLSATGTTTLQKDRWYFITAVRSGTSGKLYVNGQLESTNTNSSFNSINSLDHWHIGVSGITGTDTHAAFFSGLIDQVRIYNYARTPAQIAWDYNRGAPLAHYKLDECQGITLHSSNEVYNSSLDGTLTGATAGTCSDGTGTTAWSAGKDGKYNASLKFDGSDDYVSMSTGFASYQDNTPFSISTWMKTTSASTQALVTKWKVGSSPGYRLDMVNGQLRLVLLDAVGNGRGITTSSTYNDGQWRLVTSTYDGTQSSAGMKIYIDGTLAATSSIGNASPGTLSDTPLYIGATDSSTVPSLYFSGLIDDVRIYNYALTDIQIKELYNGGAIYFGPSSGMP